MLNMYSLYMLQEPACKPVSILPWNEGAPVHPEGVLAVAVLVC